MQNKKELKIIFFGTPNMAVDVLEEMKRGGILPFLVVTKEDTHSGRGLTMVPPPVKNWAIENNIKVLQPSTINNIFMEELRIISPDIAIVAGYGKILPKELLQIPKFGFINVHPSLLPSYRGATPVQSALLNSDTITGVTLFQIDEKMDHGEILLQEEYEIKKSMRSDELLHNLAKIGGALIPKLLLNIENNNITKTIQNDNNATYCKKISKKDGEIKLTDEPKEIYAKFRAYTPWPSIYFFHEKEGKKIRVIIEDMDIENGELKIKKVKPEGKKEMSYEDWKRGN